MFSSSRFHGNSPKCWNTIATSGRGRVTAVPSKRISPRSRGIKQSMIRNSVVLPQPLGPRIHRLSSASTSRLISCSATTSPPLKVLVRFRMTILAMWRLNCWGFQQLLDLLQKARADGAIDDPMIGGQCRGHHGTDLIPTSSATTRGATRPTARIAHCGGLMIATKLSTPSMPRLDTVKVPPS